MSMTKAEMAKRIRELETKLAAAEEVIAEWDRYYEEAKRHGCTNW